MPHDSLPLQGPLLLVDAGNTRLKAALVSGQGQFDLIEVLDPDQLADWPNTWQELVACVLLPGAAQGAQRWRRWWREQAGQRPLWEIGSDILVPDVGQYASCGIDRICAGFAALALSAIEGKAVVIDCGTATTLTAWRRLAGQPQFLGGLILPGAQCCVDGLATAAPALPQGVPLLPPASLSFNAALGMDTVVGLQNALAIGYPAMVHCCLHSLQQASGSQSVIATGGALWTIVEADGEDEHWQTVPDLTIRGMLQLTLKSGRWLVDEPAQ